MCIIVIKKGNVEFPTKAILQNCFHNNSDGAGFMYLRNNKVVIDKGYSSFGKFWKGLQKANLTIDDIIIYHFRISTSGGDGMAKTHPFPLIQDVKKLDKLDIICDKAMAHNGVLGLGTAETSDTQDFIMDILAEPLIYNNFEESKPLRKLILEYIGFSKVVILTKDGTYYTFGTFEKEYGLYFSNSSYKSINSTYSIKVNGKWVTYTDEEDEICGDIPVVPIDDATDGLIWEDEETEDSDYPSNTIGFKKLDYYKHSDNLDLDDVYPKYNCPLCNSLIKGDDWTENSNSIDDLYGSCPICETIINTFGETVIEGNLIEETISDAN